MLYYDAIISSETSSESAIKNAEEAVHVMKIAMKSLNRYKSSFEFGYDHR